MALLRKNFAKGTLAAGVNGLVTQMTVVAGHTLPINAGTFPLTIWDNATYPDPADALAAGDLEIVIAEYSGTPNVYTITRAQEGTLGVPHGLGHRAALHYTAGMSEDDLTVVADHASTHEVLGTDLVSHDSLTDFVADEHVAHGGVSIIAGTGMSGGGTIAANRTLNCSITQYTDELAQDAVGGTLDDGTVGNIVFTYDDAGGVISAVTQDGEIDHNSLLNTHNLTTDIDHNALTNYASNQHFLQTDIDHVDTDLATGLLKVTTGTGALSVITDSSANWDTAYSHSQLTSGNPHSIYFTDLLDVTPSSIASSDINKVVVIGSDLNLEFSDVSTDWDTAYSHSQLTSGNPHAVAFTDLDEVTPVSIASADIGNVVMVDAGLNLDFVDPYTLSHDGFADYAANQHFVQSAITEVGTIATGTWEATDVAILHGGTGQSTAQAAIDALTAVGVATNEHVLTKDTTTGNAIWKAATGGSDAFTVKVDAAATAGYIGAASNDGVLRTGAGISYTDGGDFVTLASTPLAGTVVQVVNFQTGAFNSGTTVIPDDDTIPQSNEGDQYMSLAFTPTSATNKLKIEVVAMLSNSYAGVHTLAAALFQDDTADALACTYMSSPAAYFGFSESFTHFMVAGTTDETTFKVRAGSRYAGSTTSFNGAASLRKLGGVIASSITITEIQV